MSELRPKIYLVLCLLALALEGVFILVHRPTLCVKCQTAIAKPSRELPSELCETCMDEIKRRIGSSSGDSVPTAHYEPPYPVDATDPFVTIKTSRGDVSVELFPRRAPRSVENFLRYVRAHRYDGVIFHRLEDYLCVSGRFTGGYDGVALTAIVQDPPIPSEAASGLENRIGTISLPHKDDDENSATSDFFFNLRDNPFYDWKGPATAKHSYAVFGQVVNGFFVLDSLRFLPLTTTPSGPGFERMPRYPIIVRRCFESAPPPPRFGVIAQIDTRVQAGAPR